MDLVINQLQLIEYTNKDAKYNKQNNERTFSLVLDEKKITEEKYKKIYIDHESGSLRATGGETFEQFKDGFSFFPDSKSPGIVRRVWREQLKKCTNIKEQFAMQMFSATCTYLLKNKKVNTLGDLNGYLNFIEEVKEYYEEGKNVPGMEPKHCEEMINIANNFESDLKKYLYNI